MLRVLGSGLCRRCRDLHTSPLLLAGHNKWSNIKHIKAKEDQARAKRNSVFTTRIGLAIRLNGNNTDPETNTQLRKVLAEARASLVPKTTIETSIKNFSKVDGKEFIIEIMFPGGIIFIVETLDKSLPNAEKAFGPILKRRGGKLQRGLLSQFEKKGLIVAQVSKSFSEDLLEEDAIEAGAEEVQVLNQEEKTVEFTTAALDLPAVKTSLEERGFVVLDAALHYLPKIPASPSPIDRNAAKALEEALEGLDNVTCIHSNL